MEKTEIILQSNGTLVERMVRERELDAGQSVLNALTEEVYRVVHNVMNIPDWGPVHANIGLTDTIWSVPIDRIPLHARFRLVNQVLVPMFASVNDLEMPLVWKAPEAVKLMFVVGTNADGESVSVFGNWLFACDQNKRGYRLPLPNLHDDCRICTGTFDGDRETAFECIQASLEQFNKSKWNADLLRTVEQSQKFFRFHPTNETFETLPIQSEDWTVLCEKVSTAIMERVVL